MGKKRILIADDQPGVRRLLVELLGRDYEIIEAASGEEVLEQIQPGIDLVLMDVKMPRIDGITALQNIVSAPGVPPVIMMTAQGQPDTAKRVMELGAAAYLEKPFDVQFLADLVARYIRE